MALPLDRELISFSCDGLMSSQGTTSDVTTLWIMNVFRTSHSTFLHFLHATFEMLLFSPRVELNYPFPICPSRLKFIEYVVC